MIPRNHLKETMNDYGRRALEHWQRTKPRELSTIPDPEAFFRVGETVASRVDRLADQQRDRIREGGVPAQGRQVAGGAGAGQGSWCGRVGVLGQHQENPDGAARNEDQAAALMQERARREMAEHQDHQQEMLGAAEQDRRHRTS